VTATARLDDRSVAPVPFAEGLWFGAGMQADQTLAQFWALGCVVAGPVLMLFGARAAGLALVGSVVSSFAGVAVTTDFDSLPVAAVAGATAGTIIFGSWGLAWKPIASGRRLRHVAITAGIVALLVIVAIHVAATRSCYYPHRRAWDTCLPYWDLGTQTLVAANAAIVVLLIVAQAAHASLLEAEAAAFSSRSRSTDAANAPDAGH
jgi:hypothetical protein